MTSAWKDELAGAGLARILHDLLSGFGIRPLAVLSFGFVAV
ncbi:hypothetical protein [Rhizobium nepotum]|nr:hypothetical protein [Rhizobium nepotum]